jgi:D-sedoheptulose 7-phosphate isomerase
MIMSSNKSQEEYFADYASRLQAILSSTDWSGVVQLAQAMLDCWMSKRQVFFCGNGGSAGNASHLVNDFLYGVARKTGCGMKALALSANPSVITCLANDVGYENIFSEQLAVQGQEGDLLIALSGSGNSPNIVKVLEQAKSIGIKSFAILGYSGGRSKSLADAAIHFPVNDMQLAEDLQLMVGHMVMQWLSENNPGKE